MLDMKYCLPEKNSEVQWILVAAEETFAIPENLRFYVAAKNSSDFHYLGHAMKFWNVIYNWADAGYVLSKGTLDKMMQKFDSDEACDKGAQPDFCFANFCCTYFCCERLFSFSQICPGIYTFA